MLKTVILDCLCLQETDNMEDGGYRTAYGWMLYYAGNGMLPGEKSGVAILIPPHRQQYLKDVIVQSYRLIAAIFAVTGGELAVITYHTPWEARTNKRTMGQACRKARGEGGLAPNA